MAVIAPTSEETEAATGSIIRSIAAAPPIGTALLQTGSAAQHGETRRPIAKLGLGNSLGDKMAISPVPAQEPEAILPGLGGGAAGQRAEAVAPAPPPPVVREAPRDPLDRARGPVAAVGPPA